MVCLMAGLSEDRAVALSRRLTGACGCDVRSCESVNKLAGLVQTGRHDVVVLGYDELGADTHQVLERIVALAPDVPVIVVADRYDSTLAAQALTAGAQDFLTIETDTSADLARTVERALGRQRFVAQLRAECWTDWLTGLLNRRGFQHCAADALRLADRSGSGLLLLVFDADNLKAVNDKHGHSAGDAALRLIAEAIRSSGRRSDIAARTGGDEFALVAQTARAPHADAILGRVRAELARRVRDASPGWEITVTPGWAEYIPNTGVGLDELLDAADLRMYTAKGAATAGTGH